MSRCLDEGRAGEGKLVRGGLGWLLVLGGLRCPGLDFLVPLIGRILLSQKQVALFV